MNKILFASLSLAAALSLNAAEYATVNGSSITDKDVAFTLAAMPGVTLEQLPKDTQKKVIDGVVWIVGENSILKSEVEEQRQMANYNGVNTKPLLKS